MNKKNSAGDFSLEQRLIHSLLLKTSFLKEVGIMSGKMGILLALVEYNKLHFNVAYEDFIGELIDDICQHIDKKLPIGFADGLSGIGWGMEFLIHNRIVDGCGVDICAEIDEKIMETDPRRIDDYGLENGLEGVLVYILVHIRNAMLQGVGLPFDETYREELYQRLNRMEKTENEKLQGYIRQYSRFHIHREIPELSFSLKPFVAKYILEDLFEYGALPLGLNKGVAGLLIKKMDCVL